MEGGSARYSLSLSSREEEEGGVETVILISVISSRPDWNM